jgi:heme oxygenase (mycobilin-producing)
MTRRARVIVWHRASGEHSGALEAAYDLVSRSLAGTPGLLGNELLQDARRPDRFAVLSEWESLDAFRRWETGAAHRDATAPLRTFQETDRGDGFFSVYQVAAAFRNGAPERSDA